MAGRTHTLDWFMVVYVTAACKAACKAACMKDCSMHGSIADGQLAWQHCWWSACLEDGSMQSTIAERSDSGRIQQYPVRHFIISLTVSQAGVHLGRDTVLIEAGLQTACMTACRASCEAAGLNTNGMHAACCDQRMWFHVRGHCTLGQMRDEKAG
mgnify:CR=1 FL=1